MSQRTSEEILNELFSSINVLKKEESPSSEGEEKEEVVEKVEETEENDEENRKKKKKSKKRKKEKKEKKKKHKHKKEKRKDKKKKKHHKDESSHSEDEQKNTKSEKQTSEIDSKVEVEEIKVDEKVVEATVDKSCDEKSGNEANGNDSDDGMLPSSEDEAINQSKDSKSKENTSQDVKCDEKKAKSRKRSKERRSTSKSRKRSRSRGRKRSRSNSTSKDRLEKKDKENHCKERRSRSGDRRAGSHDRSRSRRHRRSRSPHSSSKYRKRRSRSRDEFYIDKAKLLEIARKNALSMLKQGHVGADLNRVTAITAGGKTVDELTDFCKHLSQKEARGQLSPKSNASSDNEAEKAFHHPFQLKERPNNIVMNIRNSTALPVKSHLEKTTENATTLRLQFPVSSGQLHRKTESEWIPVTPKTEPKAIMPPPKPEPEKFPLSKDPVNSYSSISLPSKPPTTQPKPQNYSLGDVISQRLAAIRKQHESTAYPFQEMAMMNNLQMWNTDNQAGLFTGSTGARVLTQAELASGQQAWARKDQLMCAQPVTSGMGMSLLQKMGWKPGEGLGKNNEGTLEPLKLPLKMDKKGLVCAEELPNGKRRAVMNPKANINKNVVAKTAVKSLEGKHPVSLLVEYCTRRHFPSPTFTVCSESGPAHKKSFIFKVTVNGMDFMPTTPSPNKKLAKSEAATVCLRQLGLLPFVVPNPPGN